MSEDHKFMQPYPDRCCADDIAALEARVREVEESRDSWQRVSGRITEERDTLKAQLAARDTHSCHADCPRRECVLRRDLGEAVAALRDSLSALNYIRQSHGDLYGVGWDRIDGYAALVARLGAK